MQRLRILIVALPILVACGPKGETTAPPETQAAQSDQGGSTAAVPASETPPASHAPGEVRGQPVAPRTLQVLHPATNTVEALDLGQLIGRRPIAICYTLLGEPIGEEALKRFQALASEQEMKAEFLSEPIEFMGATRINSQYTVEKASARLKELGVVLPMILEERLDFGRALGATAAPSISLIDKQGILRIADARALQQEVTREKSVADAFWHVARGGQMPTVMGLKRYYPVNDLVGAPAPDFTLTVFKGTDRVRLSDHIVDGKVTALLFWHPDCAQCKAVMPSIMAGYRAFKPALEMVSVVKLENEFEERNCEDAMKAHGMDFPVLVDEDKTVTNQYFVVSTPTMLFIRPDGIVDSVYTSGKENYLPIIKARTQAILRTNSPG